jgi:hypothetical protein
MKMRPTLMPIKSWKRLRNSGWFLLFVISVAGPASAATDGPAVTITPTAIMASGITPGADVAFFGVGLEPKGYHVEVTRWSGVVTDTGHARTVTFALDRPVKWNVIWVVADLRNGHYTIASTPGFPTVIPDRPFFRLKHDDAGAPNRMGYGRPFIDGLYIEAGGAWIVAASDGAASDADGNADGETTMDLLRATPLLTGSQSPRRFTPGGTLLVIDVSRLDVLTVPVDASLIEGAR